MTDMKIPSEWTGKVYISLRVEGYGAGDIQARTYDYVGDGEVRLVSGEVTVSIPPIDTLALRGQVANNLKKKKAKILAKSEKAANEVQHKIDNLLQITYEVSDDNG